MAYSDHLRKLFPDVILEPDDILLLESFQLKYLADRVPKIEFATLLKANPAIERFILAKYPPIEEFILEIFNENEVINDTDTIQAYSQVALWEIADLIIYNKYPQTYDSTTKFSWKPEEIIDIGQLTGKTVVDVGAGTGKLSFLLQPYVKTIYAVEPVTTLRTYLRDKAVENNINNLFIVDGFLDTLPFPDQSMDMLFTSNALGWNIRKELAEIERIVKQDGRIVHLMRTIGNRDKHPVHPILTGTEYDYSYTQLETETGLKMKYWRCV